MPGRHGARVQEESIISQPQRLAARTDRGLKRSDNQDRALAQELPDGSILAAVADGVGGVGGGEAASTQAMHTLLAQLLDNTDADPGEALERAFVSANEQVRARAAQRPELRGMATTLVAALVRGQSAWLAGVGDSRAYLFHQGELTQLTQDHSWVAEQIRAGRLTEEEAEHSEFRNVITRAVGVADTVEPDKVGPISLPAGSLLLLCSDGLHRVVGDADIATVLAAGSPQEMADRLIALANEAGGPDNISVAIVAGAE
jgi:protein phosphatase